VSHLIDGDCSTPGCTNKVALVVKARYIACVACYERNLAIGAVSPTDHVAALLQPQTDFVALLVDPQSKRYTGRIILPPGVKLDEEWGTGLVLAKGPGTAAWKTEEGRVVWLPNNKPMAAIVGRRFLYRCKHKIASKEWRGLLLLHDFDLLGEIEATPLEQSAAE
jgi:hypothetical protein